ncbi:MAG: methyltransferase domain-containing protein [Propionibacteriaceae bacterium]|jgi:trans-aconitate methyltransferase|nr:methyltransferase domain-containing protein [Propionibacteriaceae bacterium]
MVDYIHGHGESVLRAHRLRTAANSAAYLVPLLSKGQSLLDVGCGEGTITRDLARSVAPGEVVGVDSAQEVIELAQAGEQLANLSFQTGDIYNLGLPRRFDVVHAHQIMHHLPDPVGAFQALAAVTKPGGVIANREGDFSAAFWYPECAGWGIWQRAFLQVGRAQGRDLSVARKLPAILKQANIGEVTVSASVWTYPGFASLEDLAESWAGRLTEPPFSDLAEESRVANKAILAEAAQQIKSWARQPEAFFAFPHVEVIVKVS